MHHFLKLSCTAFCIFIHTQASSFSLSNAIGLGNTLSRNRDKIAGTLANIMSSGSSKCPSLFARTPESILATFSRLKAKNIFWHTYDNVPAYQHFIDSNCPPCFPLPSCRAWFPEQFRYPRTFSDIPVTSKANYIKQYSISQTLLHGKLPERGQIDTSTGTSGKPTKWIRGHEEMQHVKKWINIASIAAIGHKPYIFCNMFALGPWATGMTSAYALTGKQLVVSIGPNLEMLYDTLKEMGPEQAYVIAGYPPHMKKLVEHAPFDLKKYDITMIVGGESMSTNVYKSIIEGGVKAVYSSYGASDLRINIAQQTEFEQDLQQTCAEDANFKKDLLGSLDGTPNFFHYNPLLDYIEETENGNLLFTDLDQSRISPRIRYDLGDKGKIFSTSTVLELLKQHGHTVKLPRTNLPLLCLYGRGDDALTFNGCNLMYDDLERAIVKIPGLNEKISRYAYNKFENKELDQQLEFWIELKNGISLHDLDIHPETLNNQLIVALSEVNQDFKKQIEFIKNNNDSQLPMPRTFIYEHGSSEMDEQSAHHKNKYVYNRAR